jgi:hypothetical protein
VSASDLLERVPREAVARGTVLARRVRESDYRPALIGTATAALLAWGFLLLPPMNTDMSAQLARADFAGRFPLSIIDFRWFGGTVVYGYTLWASVLMAYVGTKLTGAIAAVVATWFTSRLLSRVRPNRPTLGAVAAGVTQVANVVEGRVTFAVGLACGLGAITVLTSTRLPRATAVVLAAGLALLCGGASPVAAMLLALAGAVALVTRHRLAAGLLVLPAAASAAVIAVVFGDGGYQPFSFLDCARSLGALAVVLICVPRRLAMIRIGTMFGMVLVAAAFVLPTPVGSNATRLSLLFALPVVAACAEVPRSSVRAALLVGVCALQLPVNPESIMSTGRASGYSDYYRPVTRAVHDLGTLTGRVEVPDMAGHWDSVYLARGVPLARGWLRQTDVRLNDAVFYRHSPTPSTYWTFLQDNAVQYVAVPDAALTDFGAAEAKLIDSRLPYLEAAWTNQHWTLYRVLGASAIVASPAQVLRQSPDSVRISAPPDTTVNVRLRWSQWLGIESSDKRACIASDGLYVVLHTGVGGTYTFNSRFPSGTGHCG